MRVEIKKYKGKYYGLIDGNKIGNITRSGAYIYGFDSIDECEEILMNRVEEIKEQTLEDAETIYVKNI